MTWLWARVSKSCWYKEGWSRLCTKAHENSPRRAHPYHIRTYIHNKIVIYLELNIGSASHTHVYWQFIAGQIHLSYVHAHKLRANIVAGLAENIFNMATAHLGVPLYWYRYQQRCLTAACLEQVNRWQSRGSKHSQVSTWWIPWLTSTWTLNEGLPPTASPLKLYNRQDSCLMQRWSNVSLTLLKTHRE